MLGYAGRWATSFDFCSHLPLACLKKEDLADFSSFFHTDLPSFFLVRAPTRDRKQERPGTLIRKKRWISVMLNLLLFTRVMEQLLPFLDRFEAGDRNSTVSTI